MASHVGDMDMVRIREAEKVIDTDEVAFGKYIMDEVRRAVRARVVHAYDDYLVCVCVCPPPPLPVG